MNVAGYGLMAIGAGMLMRGAWWACRAQRTRRVLDADHAMEFIVTGICVALLGGLFVSLS